MMPMTTLMITKMGIITTTIIMNISTMLFKKNFSLKTQILMRQIVLKENKLKNSQRQKWLKSSRKETFLERSQFSLTLGGQPL